jgi:cytochrome c553
MVVSQQNFNNLNLGALATDAGGVTAGQGGWYIFNSATAAGQGAANYNIVADPNPTNSNGGPAHNGGQVLSMQAGTTATGNNVTRFAWNDDTHTARASNPAGNNLFVMTYDFYMDGGSATSTNRYGNYIYDATGAKILAGVAMQNNTGQFYILGNYNNAGTVGNFSFKQSLAFPLKARVTANGKTHEMPGNVTTGDCASCHGTTASRIKARRRFRTLMSIITAFTFKRIAARRNIRRQHPEALRRVVHAVPRVRNPAQRPLVVLRLEPQVALAHDHHHRHAEHVQRAQPPDVPLHHRELLRRLCACSSQCRQPPLLRYYIDTEMQKWGLEL